MPASIWAAEPVAQVSTTLVSPVEAALVKLSPSVNLFEALYLIFL